MKAPSTDDELELLEKKIEEENQGPNTKDLVKIALFVIIGAVLIYLLLGVFGFLSQAEYGGP